MLTAVRRDAIKSILTEKKSATVLELAEMFSVTDETIRRDLAYLEKCGFVSKIRGGAIIQDGVFNEFDIHLRANIASDKKRQIAARCVHLINDGDFIFLDSSTTVYEIAEQIAKMKLTVLTNSLRVCNLLSAAPGIHLICIGGNYDPNNMAFFGSNASRSLGSYHVDKAFFSCNSANLKFGVMDSNENASEFRKCLIAQSNQPYLCIDSSKFDKVSFYSMCSFQALHAIVTDKLPSPEWTDSLSRLSVRVLLSSAENIAEAI